MDRLSNKVATSVPICRCISVAQKMHISQRELTVNPETLYLVLRKGEGWGEKRRGRKGRGGKGTGKVERGHG